MLLAAQEVLYWFRAFHFYITMQCNQSNCNSVVLLCSDFASIFITLPSLIDSVLHRCSCAADCQLRFHKFMYVWINSFHCCMADILLNVRQAKYLFSNTLVRPNSDCDVINATCLKAMITWKFFSYVFWQWDQSHHLFQIQSDLFVWTPINQNPHYPKQIARNRFFPTHFTPLIRKPRCPTPSWKLRNGYVISIERKTLNRIKPTVTC